MNKITKIGVLGLALCFLLTALHTSAQQQLTGSKNQKLSLKLSAAENSCEMIDYDFGSFQVSAIDQRTAEKTGRVKCTLLKSPAIDISFQLSDLQNGSSSAISGSKFTGAFVDVTKNGSLNEATSHTNFAFPKEVYEKEVNKVGVWSGTLKISGTIPGGTPEGTYTGNLDLVITAHQ